MRRVLFTGLGSIGSRHLRLLRERDEAFEVHAYRSGSSDTSTPEGVIEHTDLEAALEANPDIAFVTNPTAKHVQTATACAKTGCDLFVEKPLSHTLSNVDKLITVAEERDLVTKVGCQLRFHPVLQRVRTVLNRGTIGKVFSFRAYAGSYLPDWRPEQDYRDSYSADSALGGGVVLDLIHEIDYCYWLFGDVAGVRAWTGQVSDLEIRSEDLAELIIETESETVGQIHLDYYRPEPRRTLEITGREGLLRADLNDQTVRYTTQDGETRDTFDVNRDDVFRAQLDDFLANVRSREPADNDLREAKEVLGIALNAKGV